MASVSVTESESTVLALNARQAAALQEAGRRLVSDKSWWGSEDLSPERTAIRCEPTQDGQWRVTVVNAVGLIALGDELQISVLPKIPTSHLLYLFAASGRFPKLDQQRGLLTPSDSLWDLVAEWFVTALEGTVRRDLRRDYEVITDALTQLRGTIDPLRSAIAYYAGRVALTCEFDDFNVDTPLNRVLRAAALIVVRSPDLTTVLRRRARTMLACMDDVGVLRPADLRVRVDRCTAHYADSLLLAHHVLAATGRTFEAGGLSARTFLLRTPEAVEEGLRQILVRHLPGIDVVKRGRRLSPSSLTLTPDLLFDHSRAVADIKYKVATGEWKRPDLYQIVTFATGFHLVDAAVIEFSTSGGASAPTVRVGPVRVCHLAWPADADRSPNDSVAQLIVDIRAWLEHIPMPAAVA